MVSLLMKAISIVLSCFALLLMVSACARPADRPATSVEEAVRSFADAYRDGDVETVDALLANDYVHINSGAAPGDRDSYLAWNRTRAENLGGGEWSVETYDLSELQIKTYDDAAVVTGRVTASGVRDGENWASDIRFTNLWVIEDGAWKRAAFHDAAVPAPAP